MPGVLWPVTNVLQKARLRNVSAYLCEYMDMHIHNKDMILEVKEYNVQDIFLQVFNFIIYKVSLTLS